MTRLHHSGNRTAYNGSESRRREYPLRYLDNTGDAIEQFERMSRGFAPRPGDGVTVTWVRDDTLTDDQRQWCAQTAAEIRREAELAGMKPTSRRNRNGDEIEAEIERVLAERPDISVNQMVLITNIQRPRVLGSEAWICAHMGKRGER